MTESTLLSKVAELLRPVSNEVFYGKGKLCLSTLYLRKLNLAFDEHVPDDVATSFHITDSKASLQRDLKFLFDLIQGTVALKVIPDLIESRETEAGFDLRRFENLKALEIHKIDVKYIFGIQKLRSQIHELTISHNLEHLGDILDKCGGDLSQSNLWNELRKANFSHNKIVGLDNSLELTPWLVTLDLSHNQLANVDFINNLPNLKYLNVSFNKLDKVPKFKGQVCKILQVLILSNNFIEDLSGLITISNLLQLDLSRNCILEHQVLMSITHMPSLHFLNLQGNPINFHPHHRNTTCQYLNKNTASLNFILDNVALNKSEKSFAGYWHPLVQGSMGSSNNSSMNSLENSVHEKQKKVRNVIIQEGHSMVVEAKKTPVSTPKMNTGHLEMKKQVEQLRQEYGDSWLYSHSGGIFQDVLGFEKSTVLSSTPLEASLRDMGFTTNMDLVENKNESAMFETAKDELLVSESKENFESAEENDFFSSSIHEESEEQLSDDDEGEMFYVSSTADNTESDLCIIITNTHLSERDAVSVKEKARWNLNTVHSCEKGTSPNEVQIKFDTVRKNRQFRIYYMDEYEKFISLIQPKIIPEKKIDYQCMKCNETFSRIKQNRKDNDNDLACPKCQSIHIIETHKSL